MSLQWRRRCSFYSLMMFIFALSMSISVRSWITIFPQGHGSSVLQKPKSSDYWAASSLEAERVLLVRCSHFILFFIHIFTTAWQLFYVYLAAALNTASLIASKSPIAVIGTKRLLLHARDHRWLNCLNTKGPCFGLHIILRIIQPPFSVTENLEYTATWNQVMLQSEVRECPCILKNQLWTYSAGCSRTLWKHSKHLKQNRNPRLGLYQNCNVWSSGVCRFSLSSSLSVSCFFWGTTSFDSLT